MPNFGETTIPQVLLKDWTLFWQFWHQNAKWNLEYFDGSAWVSVKSDLQVVKAFPEEWLCKISLKFVASHNADYRLTFAINRAVKTYVHKEAEHQYSLTVDDDTLLFDWNDVLSIPGIEITHGVTDGFFWWRARRDNVPLGAQVTIDPVFGYDTMGTNGAGIENLMEGPVFPIPEDGVGISMSAGLKSPDGWNAKVKCAVYRHSDLKLIGQTEERTIAVTTTFTFYTFNFAVQPHLVKGTDYVLLVWAEAAAGACQLAFAFDASADSQYKAVAYGGWPDPAVLTDSVNLFSVYCTYEADPAPVGSFPPRKYRIKKDLFRDYFALKLKAEKLMSLFGKSKKFDGDICRLGSADMSKGLAAGTRTHTQRKGRVYFSLPSPPFAANSLIYSGER